MARAGKACGKDGGRCPHLRPCPVPGHERKAWEGSTRRAELPRDWNRRCRAVLERDPICTICGDRPSTDVHHTGDRHDHRLEVLAGVCGDCHTAETQRQAAEARARSGR